MICESSSCFFERNYLYLLFFLDSAEVPVPSSRFSLERLSLKTSEARAYYLSFYLVLGRSMVGLIGLNTCLTPDCDRLVLVSNS